MAAADSPPDWMFLRGLARESAHWAGFPERFGASVGGVRILQPDLPGSGRHWRLTSPASIPAIMEFVRREALSETPSASHSPRYILALSLGAMVAVEWLFRHPAEVAGAVLINTSLRGLSPLYRRLHWHAWPALTRIVSLSDVRSRERSILQLTSVNGARDPALIDAYARAWRERPMRRSNVIRQLCAAAAYRPPLHKPRMPVLLLSGAGDRLVHPACSAAIAKRWSAPLAIHPWAGHDLPLDDPDWVIRQVSAWFDAPGSGEPVIAPSRCGNDSIM